MNAYILQHMYLVHSEGLVLSNWDLDYAAGVYKDIRLIEDLLTLGVL